MSSDPDFLSEFSDSTPHLGITAKRTDKSSVEITLSPANDQAWHPSSIAQAEILKSWLRQKFGNENVTQNAIHGVKEKIITVHHPELEEHALFSLVRETLDLFCREHAYELDDPHAEKHFQNLVTNAANEPNLRNAIKRGWWTR